MQVISGYRPSPAMNKEFGEAEAPKHAQDGVVVAKFLDGTIVLAVVDGAKNMGSGWICSSLAVQRGLGEHIAMNGGEIFATTVQNLMISEPIHGLELVVALNVAIEDAYATVGLEPDLTRREELFTGYFCHVLIEPDGMVHVTTVGDGYCHINGEHVAGEEK